MKSYQENGENNELKRTVQEDSTHYLASLNEEERLRKAIYLSDMEKLRLFTQMLRANALFKRAIVSHKK